VELYTAEVLVSWREDSEDLARREKGRPDGSRGLVPRFAVIRLDPYCAWVPTRRFPTGFGRGELELDIGFHEVAEQSWRELGISTRSHTMDPVFDVSLANDSEEISVVSAVGVEPVKMWSTLKGYPVAFTLRSIGRYVLQVDRFVPGRKQMLELEDPIAVPPKGAGRLSLQLRGFREAVRDNNGLIRLCVVADAGVVRSRLIYMGMY